MPGIGRRRSGGPPPGGSVVGIGVDLCEVDRMRRSLDRTPTLRDRLFTPAEQADCDARRDPAERYAARFAAKEAVLKALGAGLGACPLRDIEVVRSESGAPALALHGSAARLAAERGVARWHVSLTHTALMAEAMVVAVGR
ncbi:MAG TPA: holo-ACP synthase [Acidimicrobiales bacterium]